MVTLKEEDGRITNLQQALPAGLTTITDCKDFNFAITDQDDFICQADIVLSIGGSGILSPDGRSFEYQLRTRQRLSQRIQNRLREVQPENEFKLRLCDTEDPSRMGSVMDCSSLQ